MGRITLSKEHLEVFEALFSQLCFDPASLVIVRFYLETVIVEGSTIFQRLLVEFLR
jgi:hypothetical protein